MKRLIKRKPPVKQTESNKKTNKQQTAQREIDLGFEAMSEPTTILIYGDSNTWGFDFDTMSRFAFHQRWPNLLQHALNDQNPSGKDFHVIAEGLNGRTTIFDRYIDFEGQHNLNGRNSLPHILHSHKPLDLVVLALGTNDLCGDCGPAEQAIERCLSGVQQLVDDIRSMESHIGSSTFSILVLGLPPLVSTEVNLTWKFPSNLRHVREEANDRLRIWCLEQHIDYLDISHVLTLNAIDGIHLTETDQMAMSEIVYQKLQAIYYSS